MTRNVMVLATVRPSASFGSSVNGSLTGSWFSKDAERAEF